MFNTSKLGEHDGVSFDKSYINLGHEVAHAWQDMIGYNASMHQTYGLTEMAEIFAVRFENYLRALSGEKKMRMYYHEQPLNGMDWLTGWNGRGFKSSSPEYFANMKMPLRRYEIFYPIRIDGNKELPGAPRMDNVYYRNNIIVPFIYDTRNKKFHL